MTISVRLFAAARQLAGRDTVSLELAEGCTVADLRTILLKEIPELTPLAGSVRLAVNAQYADDATRIPPGADVAVIPPVSGG